MFHSNDKQQFVLSTKVLYSAFLNHPTLGTCFFLRYISQLEKAGEPSLCLLERKPERHPGSDPPACDDNFLVSNSSCVKQIMTSPPNS